METFGDFLIYYVMESAKTDTYLKHIACPIFKPNGRDVYELKCNIYPIISVLSN